MASYVINQYQAFEFLYPSAAVGLYIANLPAGIGFYNNFDGTYTFEVDPQTVVGVTNYTVLDALNAPIDTITLTVVIKLPDETHTLCLSDINNLYPLPVPPSGIWNYTDDYINEMFQLLPFGNGVLAVLIAGRTGTFNMLFQTTTNPLAETYLIEINIESCLEEYLFCSPYKLPVLWLNRAGGYSSYCFKGKKTFGYDIGKRLQYKTTERVKKNYYIGDVYQTVFALSGEIPKSHIEFIKGLKYSIQAWIFTPQGYLPITFDENNFTYYTEGDGFAKYNIEVSISTEVIIQTG
jgi:hypothetical protein